MKKVIICGAGIAGISAAFHLAKAGFKVEIFESRKQIGGCCFSTNLAKTPLPNKINEIDNGQHIFAGIYHNFFEIIKWLDKDNLFNYKDVMYVKFKTLSGETFEFKPLKLLGKLGVLYALFNINTVSISAKFRTLNVFKKLLKNIHNDTTTLDFLRQTNQDEKMIKCFWEPVILATLNSPVHLASTKLFSNVIKKLILSNSKDAALFFANAPLSDIFDNFDEKFSELGGKLYLNNKVKKIIIRQNQCVGIETQDGEKHFAEYVISALPPKQLYNICPYFKDHYTNFPSSPIISIYLLFDRIIMEEEFIGCIDTNIQWIFNQNKIINKFSLNNSQQLAITISAANELINLNNSDLLVLILSELHVLFPLSKFAILHDYKILKDKNATPLITSENGKFRPTSQTDIKKFFIIGGWTETNLPATIESAASSAKLLLKHFL